MTELTNKLRDNQLDIIHEKNQLAIERAEITALRHELTDEVIKAGSGTTTAMVFGLLFAMIMAIYSLWV